MGAVAFAGSASRMIGAVFDARAPSRLGDGRRISKPSTWTRRCVGRAVWGECLLQGSKDMRQFED